MQKSRKRHLARKFQKSTKSTPIDISRVTFPPPHATFNPAADIGPFKDQKDLPWLHRLGL